MRKGHFSSVFDSVLFVSEEGRRREREREREGKERRKRG